MQSDLVFPWEGADTRISRQVRFLNKATIPSIVEVAPVLKKLHSLGKDLQRQHSPDLRLHILLETDTLDSPIGTDGKPELSVTRTRSDLVVVFSPTISNDTTACSAGVKHIQENLLLLRVLNTLRPTILQQQILNNRDGNADGQASPSTTKPLKPIIAPDDIRVMFPRWFPSCGTLPDFDKGQVEVSQQALNKFNRFSSADLNLLYKTLFNEVHKRSVKKFTDIRGLLKYSFYVPPWLKRKIRSRNTYVSLESPALPNLRANRSEVGRLRLLMTMASYYEKEYNFIGPIVDHICLMIQEQAKAQSNRASSTYALQEPASLNTEYYHCSRTIATPSSQHQASQQLGNEAARNTETSPQSQPQPSQPEHQYMTMHYAVPNRDQNGDHVPNTSVQPTAVNRPFTPPPPPPSSPGFVPLSPGPKEEAHMEMDFDVEEVCDPYTYRGIQSNSSSNHHQQLQPQELGENLQRAILAQSQRAEQQNDGDETQIISDNNKQATNQTMMNSHQGQQAVASHQQNAHQKLNLRQQQPLPQQSSQMSSHHPQPPQEQQPIQHQLAPQHRSNPPQQPNPHPQMYQHPHLSASAQPPAQSHPQQQPQSYPSPPPQLQSHHPPTQLHPHLSLQANPYVSPQPHPQPHPSIRPQSQQLSHPPPPPPQHSHLQMQHRPFSPHQQHSHPHTQQQQSQVQAHPHSSSHPRPPAHPCPSVSTYPHSTNHPHAPVPLNTRPRPLPPPTPPQKQPHHQMQLRKKPPVRYQKTRQFHPQPSARQYPQQTKELHPRSSTQQHPHQSHPTQPHPHQVPGQGPHAQQHPHPSVQQQHQRQPPVQAHPHPAAQLHRPPLAHPHAPPHTHPHAPPHTQPHAPPHSHLHAPSQTHQPVHSHSHPSPHPNPYPPVQQHSHTPTQQQVQSQAPRSHPPLQVQQAIYHPQVTQHQLAGHPQQHASSQHPYPAQRLASNQMTQGAYPVHQHKQHVAQFQGQYQARAQQQTVQHQSPVQLHPQQQQQTAQVHQVPVQHGPQTHVPHQQQTPYSQPQQGRNPSVALQKETKASVQSQQHLQQSQQNPQPINSAQCHPQEGQAQQPTGRGLKRSHPEPSQQPPAVTVKDMDNDGGNTTEDRRVKLKLEPQLPVTVKDVNNNGGNSSNARQVVLKVQRQGESNGENGSKDNIQPQQKQNAVTPEKVQSSLAQQQTVVVQGQSQGKQSVEKNQSPDQNGQEQGQGTTSSAGQVQSQRQEQQQKTTVAPPATQQEAEQQGGGDDCVDVNSSQVKNVPSGQNQPHEKLTDPQRQNGAIPNQQEQSSTQESPQQDKPINAKMAESVQTVNKEEKSKVKRGTPGALGNESSGDTTAT